MSAKSILLLFSFVAVISFTNSTDSHETDEVESDDQLLGDHKEAFLSFKERFNRTCVDGTDQCRARKKHFASNMNKLNELKHENATSFELGVTEFMDWSPEEIHTLFIPKEKMRQYRHRRARVPKQMKRRSMNETLERNAGTWDWRSTGAVNPIRNQGNCGSCWAFAAVAAIETQYNHRKKTLNAKRQQFSEQFIIDCDKIDWGCNGGLPQSAIRFVKGAGLVPRSSYSYKGKRGPCLGEKFTFSKRTRPVKQVKMLSRNIPGMIQFVRHQGPLAAGLWVCNDFMYYTHGIYDNRKCKGANSLGGHAMAIIGYGTDNGKDYWLLRNQWGTNWGLGGYIKMARGVDVCAIESWGVSAPIV